MAAKSVNTTKALLIVGLIFAVLGIVFSVIGGAVLYSSKQSEKNCTFETKGTVVELVEKRSRNKHGTSTTYAPVFEYEYNGKVYKYESKLATSPKPFEVGDKVTVMVDPDDPKEIYVPEYKTVRIFSYVFLGVGGGLFIAGIILLFVFLKKRRTQELDEIAAYNSGYSASFNDQPWER